jgi:Protein of unknown function (DUF1566)
MRYGLPRRFLSGLTFVSLVAAGSCSTRSVMGLQTGYGGAVGGASYAGTAGGVMSTGGVSGAGGAFGGAVGAGGTSTGGVSVSGTGGAGANGGAGQAGSGSTAAAGSGGTAGAGAGGSPGTEGYGTGGACGGAAGLAACCTNACASVGTQCGSSTSLLTCSMTGSGCTELATSTCSTGLLCERIAPAACVDPTWAEWLMPNSPVDVTAGAPNPEAYTDNGDQTITDNVTGLMWQKAVPTGTYTWAQALAYCPTLTLGGYSDWRIPSRIELVSIVDFGQSYPSINTTYFPATPANGFWASAAEAGQSPPVSGMVYYAWGVSFALGGSGPAEVTTYHNVRCVR